MDLLGGVGSIRPAYVFDPRTRLIGRPSIPSRHADVRLPIDFMSPECGEPISCFSEGGKGVTASPSGKGTREPPEEALTFPVHPLQIHEGLGVDLVLVLLKLPFRVIPPLANEFRPVLDLSVIPPPSTSDDFPLDECRLPIVIESRHLSTPEDPISPNVSATGEPRVSGVARRPRQGPEPPVDLLSEVEQRSTMLARPKSEGATAESPFRAPAHQKRPASRLSLHPCI